MVRVPGQPLWPTTRHPPPRALALGHLQTQPTDAGVTAVAEMKRRLDHDSTVAAAIVSTSARMRSAALMTICEIDNAARTPHAGTIVNLLADSNDCVCETAFSALHTLDEIALTPHISTMVGFLTYSRVSRGIAWVLQDLEAALLIPHTDAIMGLFIDPMSGFDVWQLCCKLEPTKLAMYTGSIVGMLDDSRVRDGAIRLLASGRIRMRAPDITLACDAVTNMLTDAKENMRYWAAKALRKLKSKRARLHWATARVYRVRKYGRFWYEDVLVKLCAPGGKWAALDLVAFQAEFT